MQIQSIHTVVFSPAGSTKKVIESIASVLADRLGAELVRHEYTLPEQREEKMVFGREDLVIWGTPVYAGRIPNKTLEYVKGCFEGNKSPAVPVVVYGNRNFDQALSELTGILKEGGLIPVAAAAVVARHVFSDSLAKGRPDEEDMREITAFAEGISGKMQSAASLSDLDAVAVPGPYPPECYYTPRMENGEPAKFLKALPVIDMDKCCGCGECAGLCPMDSIHMTEKGIPEIKGVCIKCQACILTCPSYAICLTDEAFLSHKRMLEKTFTKRKKALFLL